MHRNRVSGSFGFHGISGGYDGHLRQGPHDCQVLSCVVCRTERPIGESATYSNNFYIGGVIADIVPHLFETAENWEIRNGICEDNFPGKCKAGGDSGHILFGNSGIEKLARKSSRERFGYAKSKVSNYQENPFITLGQFQESFKEGASHSPPPNSAIPSAISSPFGER